MSKHLPRDAMSGTHCNKCGKEEGYHRVGCSCTRDGLVSVEHGYFMPPDMKFVSNTDLREQGYVGDDEPANEARDGQ